MTCPTTTDPWSGQPERTNLFTTKNQIPCLLDSSPSPSSCWPPRPATRPALCDPPGRLARSKITAGIRIPTGDYTIGWPPEAARIELPPRSTWPGTGGVKEDTLRPWFLRMPLIFNRYIKRRTEGQDGPAHGPACRLRLVSQPAVRSQPGSRSGVHLATIIPG